MRFVTPGSKRLDLKDGPEGEKNWIEVRLNLTVGEEKRFRSAGFRQLTPGSDPEATEQKDAKIDVDWARLAFARAEAYILDWSAKDAKGKDIRFSRGALESLHPDDFDEIDKAIQAHIDEQAASKKETGGVPPPVLITS